MKRSITRYLTIVAALLLTVGCEEEEPVILEGTGITGQSWESIIEVDEEGENLSLTFASDAAWTASLRCI